MKLYTHSSLTRLLALYESVGELEESFNCVSGAHPLLDTPIRSRLTLCPCHTDHEVYETGKTSDNKLTLCPSDVDLENLKTEPTAKPWS